MNRANEFIALYVVAALLAGANAILAKRLKRDREQYFWLIASTILLLCAVLRYFRSDLQIIAELRIFARADGWYAYRRAVQIAVLVVLAASAVVVVRARSRMHGFRDGSLISAAVSLVLLLMVVSARASSLHWFDAALGTPVGQLKLSALFEGACLLGVLASAAWYRIGRPAEGE